MSADAPATASPRADSVVAAGIGSTTLVDDGYVLNHAAISGGTLSVSVSYAGGCETHALTLVIAASFIESSPVQLHAVLRHDANGDACEAWLTHSYAFDLAIARTRYRPSTATVPVGWPCNSTVLPPTVWSTNSPGRAAAPPRPSLRVDAVADGQRLLQSPPASSGSRRPE